MHIHVLSASTLASKPPTFVCCGSKEQRGCRTFSAPLWPFVSGAERGGAES